MKVRTSEEVAAAKTKEREEKARMYVALREKIIAKRMQGDASDATLSLTETLLANNPDFSTIWNYRREILLQKLAKATPQECEELCNAELVFVETCVMKNPKSYNAWHQRRWILAQSRSPQWDHEISLCSKFLQLDERNFHCWNYRRYVAAQLPDKENAALTELEYTMDRIGKNFSNYSAWHNRSKLLGQIYGDVLPDDVAAAEIELTHNAFYIEPKDQSAWFYHRWVLGSRARSPVVVAVNAASKPATRQAVMTCVFSQPIVLDPLPDITNKSGEKISAVVWTRLCGGSVYLATMSDISPNTELTINLEHEAFTSSAKSISIATPTTHGPIASHVMCTDVAMATNAWRPVRQETLSSELTACQELLEVLDAGYERKWTLLSLFHIGGALGDSAAHVVDDALAQLLQVDPIRTLYYRDLHSRVLLTRVVDKLLSQPQPRIDVSKMGLVRIPIAHLFSGLVSVNLSNNALTSASCLQSCVLASTVNLDDNQIEEFCDISHLPYLSLLSIQRNRINGDAGVFGCLGTPQCALQVNVYGNPIASTFTPTISPPLLVENLSVVVTEQQSLDGQ